MLWYFRGTPRNRRLLCGALAILAEPSLHQVATGLGCFQPYIMVGLSLLGSKMKTPSSCFGFGERNDTEETYFCDTELLVEVLLRYVTNLCWKFSKE